MQVLSSSQSHTHFCVPTEPPTLYPLHTLTHVLPGTRLPAPGHWTTVTTISPRSPIGRARVESRRLFTLVHIHRASHKESVVLFNFTSKSEDHKLSGHLFSIFVMKQHFWVWLGVTFSFLQTGYLLFFLLVSRFPSPCGGRYNQTLLRCIVKSCSHSQKFSHFGISETPFGEQTQLGELSSARTWRVGKGWWSASGLLRKQLYDVRGSLVVLLISWGIININFRLLWPFGYKN